jgi:hypothetical protein
VGNGARTVSRGRRQAGGSALLVKVHRYVHLAPRPASGGDRRTITSKWQKSRTASKLQSP